MVIAQVVVQMYSCFFSVAGYIVDGSQVSVNITDHGIIYLIIITTMLLFSRFLTKPG